MNQANELLLYALRCAVHGKGVQWTERVSNTDLRHMKRRALEHSVFPMIIEAIHPYLITFEDKSAEHMQSRARSFTIAQANRTAEFLLVYQSLRKHGLDPIVLKGIICRSIYPIPEQRASVDEDLLIEPSEFELYSELLDLLGFTCFDKSYDNVGRVVEAAFKHSETGSYLELHGEYFSAESEAYGECNSIFNNSNENTIRTNVFGTDIRTLSPADHLLYLICHAYKHFLHGGFGIRQVCDINLFADRFGDAIDFQYVLSSLEKLHIEYFTAAIFKIGQHKLGFISPSVFRGIEVDEHNMLEDILSGGLYGVVDINRAHSSTITLDAVASSRSGKRSKGAIHSVFLPAQQLKGRYPYLSKRPWLLPVAWTQRVFSYIFNRSRTVKPTETLRIGRDRVALLRQYRIID